MKEQFVPVARCELSEERSAVAGLSATSLSFSFLSAAEHDRRANAKHRTR